MTTPGSASGRPRGLLLSRLIWPVAMLFAATLWLVVSTILWTSESANEVAVDRQRSQLSAALRHHLDDLRTGLAEFARRQGLQSSSPTPAGLSRFGEHALAMKDFDGLALVDQNGTALAGIWDGQALTPEAASRVGSLARPIATPNGRGPGETAELFFDGRNVYAALILPVSVDAVPDGAGAWRGLLVAHRYLSARAVQKIAGFSDIDRLRISTEAPADPAASLPLRDPRGDVSAYLSWTPDRPGDVMWRRLIPLSLVGFSIALVLFGLVALHLRWLLRDLAVTEARSRDLLGRDPLSGLSNRLLFSERLDRELERAPRTENGLAVLFVDLDRFKDVNDTYGHRAGDDLIQLVARRLLDLVGPDDIIARFGGDEFAIVQTGIAGPHEAAALARRILDALAQTFAIAETQVSIGASIGIALAPDDSDNREILMGLADTALYQAKSEGRNRYVFFQSRMDETIQMRKVVEADLRRAIADDQLVLHYQPLYAADGASIVSVEALVRWLHPVRGMISPVDFISVAEERGLIIPLGDWVLRRACQDAKRWPGIRVAVNVSPIQFRHRDFVPKVIAMLVETGFDPSRLELELTEGVVVDDADAAESAMMELRALGIHLALDDFGTGYSSLIYLRRFAFDTIKIDRSFLESMEATGESAILVHSMVHLGRALGLTVTAEGVETPEQHRFLQALGCHQLQGFLFSKPRPAHEIDALVEAARPRTRAA